MSYKLSTFRFLINRAFRIELGDELEKIKLIAIDNGYQVKLINKLIQSSFVTSKNKNESINEVNMKRVVANYFPVFFEHIKNHLRNFGLSLIAKPLPKLKMLLNTKIDPINRNDLSEVHMNQFIREEGINNHFIGITQRKFDIRCKEHIADIKYNTFNTALSRLNQIENINILFNECKIIYRSIIRIPNLLCCFSITSLAISGFEKLIF